MSVVRRVLVSVSLVVAASAPAAAFAATPEHIAQPHGSTRLISLTPDGAPGDNDSNGPSLSSDATLIAYSSAADDLVAGDTNGAYDVYLFNRADASTTRLSHATDGGEPDSDCYGAVLSGGGRFVVFESRASNLVTQTTNGKLQLYLYDRQKDATSLVSQNAAGAGANGDTQHAAIDASGRYIAYVSVATDLVAGDTNGAADVFLFDTRTGATSLVTHAADGSPANSDSYEVAISANGSVIAVSSYATNLIAGDTNGASNVFAIDRRTGQVELVSVNRDGAPADENSNGPRLSPDGSYVGFSSVADDIAGHDDNQVSDVYLRNRAAGVTRLISRAADGESANADSYVESISNRARIVTFFSWSTDLVDAVDTNTSPDVFLRDRRTGISLVSKTPSGAAGDAASDGSVVDLRGRVVAFDSASTDLVRGGANGYFNVYLFRLPAN